MMDASFRAELENIIETFSVAPGSYSIQEKYYSVGSGTEDAGSADLPKDIFLQHVKGMLYRLHHCRQEDYQRGFVPQHYHSNRDLVESFSEANSGMGTWEPGWQVRRIEKNGQIAVQKDGLTLWVRAQQFIAVEGERKVEPGKKGYIAMAREFRSLLPGFYMANGNAPLDQRPVLARIYWNISAPGAVDLLKHITTELNSENISFQFKIINRPECFTRADAGVLYMNKQYLEKSRDALARVYGQIRKFLKPKTPLFAKRLGYGVSLAEDPHNGDSFGQHCMQILAQALYNTHEKGISSRDEKIKEVARHFGNRKIDLDAPYLSPGSVDSYDGLRRGVFEG